MRRIWMLLLVVALMVIALAVPAMAETTHDHTDGTWTELTAGTTIEKGKQYYLTGDLDASYTIAFSAGADSVTICLNGNTWSGDGTQRPLKINNGDVTICDCQYTAPTVDDSGNVGEAGGGKIVGHNYGTTGSDGGGAINVSGAYATLNLENCTVTGGTALNGGNIYGLGTVNVTEATIRGGSAEQGGNLYQAAKEGNTKKLTITNAIVTGGVSTDGAGNIYIHERGQLAVDGQQSLISLGSTTGDGGNIGCLGSMSLNAGKVSNGSATGGGDNVYIKSQTVTFGAVTVTDDATTSHSNVYVDGSKSDAKVTMKKATITGAAGKDNLRVYARATGINVEIAQSTLTGDAIDLICDSGKDLTVKIAGTSTISGEPVQSGDGDITINYYGILVDGDWTTVYDLNKAGTVSNKQGTSYLKVLTNAEGKYNGQTMFVQRSYYLDLNGMKLTNVGVGNGTAKINLIDNTANNYTAGRGSVTMNDGVACYFARDCRTASISEQYGDHNYRFVVIKDAEGKYTAHRIFLAVRSASLIAQANPAAAFRIALKCDADVAANLAGYGLHMNYNDNHLAYYTTEVDASTDNSRLVGLTYTSAEAGDVDSKITSKAYIILKDSFDTYTEVTDADSAITALKAAGTNVVTSGGTNLSLMDIVKDADSLLAAGKLTEKQVTGLTDMITGWAGTAMKSFKDDISAIFGLLAE